MKTRRSRIRPSTFGGQTRPRDRTAKKHCRAAGIAARQSPTSRQFRTKRIIAGSEAPDNSTALYPALSEAAPAVRAKQLTLALHWDRSLPENSAKPMSLPECLAREAGGNRRETLAVYWLARQRAAEYQAIAQESEFLENLSSDALERRNEPTGAVDMLYLRAARLSAKAALEEAQRGAGRKPIRIGACERNRRPKKSGRWPPRRRTRAATN